MKKSYNFEHIIGHDQTIKDLLNLIGKVKDADVPVLIEGESGVGKELVARAIHYNSIRKDEPFINVNCGAIPESLLESEFFGHEKGAFTGAANQKIGYIKAAGNGTIFLDEIDDLNFNLQVKLLHVLQSGEFTPVGNTKAQPTNARFLAASKHSLKTLVESGKFRDDLFYRLNVLRIYVPPLRSRKKDIPELCKYFLQKHCKKMEKNKLTLTSRTINTLLNYDFPGNVRELENIIKRAIVLSDSNLIDLEQLPFEVQENPGATNYQDLIAYPFADAKRKVIEDFEKNYLICKLKEHNGVVLKAAKSAGMYEANFRKKMKTYGITADRLND